MSDEAFDYVVVGSGAGGASAARVIADATSSVAIVEEGPAVSTEEFSDRSYPTLARLYRDMGAQITQGRAPMLVIQGRCLGGSTVINSAIVRRLPEEVWREWRDVHRLGDSVRFSEVEEASTAIERELRVAPTAEAVWGGNNGLLSRAAVLGGIAGSPTRRNAPGCRGSARCNLGCPHGAKQSMQLSYLPYATARGARVFTDERVTRVVLRGERATGVETRSRSLVARRAVLVAASAIETPRLLWRSGLRSRHLGRHLQGHPGMGVVGLFDSDVRLGLGATQGFELDGLRSDGRVKIETLALPPETFFGGLPGVGREWLGLMSEFQRAAVWVLPFRSFAEGEVGVGRRERSIAFKLDPRDLPNLRRGLRRATDLMFAAGAGEVVCPVHGLPHRLLPGQSHLIEEAGGDASSYPLAMSHLFGTTRMSQSPEDGVVAPDFRVHGTENLYVVDSSVFPTNLGVNPQLAIMSLARIAAGEDRRVTLGSLLETSGATPDDVVEHVSSLSPSLRQAECLALTPTQQGRLWLLISSTAGGPIGELVPGATAVFAGRNSLQLFSRFEKWFARQDGATFGCNRHALSPLIGPGYFTVLVDGSERLEFDYGGVPSHAPAGWPEIRGNSSLLARPVYGDLLDRVRWISPDVLVGAAFRHGSPLDSYFVLVRTAR